MHQEATTTTTRTTTTPGFRFHGRQSIVLTTPATHAHCPTPHAVAHVHRPFALIIVIRTSHCTSSSSRPFEAHNQHHSIPIRVHGHLALLQDRRIPNTPLILRPAPGCPCTVWYYIMIGFADHPDITTPHKKSPQQSRPVYLSNYAPCLTLSQLTS
ncbi:hypothetical protein R3P38DRAFT_3184962 [Favolaschia claudopus]|uniref:Uncharacterized protein n=1 Tax=Favolaschia claudopus TaxID=2862362 RepID=A0AAW0C4B0_9AGAR